MQSISYKTKPRGLAGHKPGHKINDMDKGKEKQLTDAFFKQVGFLGNSEKAMEVISQQLGILFSELEVNTNSKLASMKAFLEHRGLMVPDNFMSFINWHIYAYPDELDEKGLLAIKQEHIAEYCQKRTKELDAHLSKGNDNGTQPEGLQCIKRIKLEDLKFIFSKLTESGMLDKSVTEANFVTTFQAGALPDGWKPNKWKGSNPELATLVNQLTELRPLPSLVNQYFKPATIFDSQKTRDINNKRIIELVAAALK